MGVFGWFRRGQAAESTRSAATATVTGDPQTQQAPTDADRAEDAHSEAVAGAAHGAARGAAESSTDPVGIPKQQSADGAADSESGEGARA